MNATTLKQTVFAATEFESRAVKALSPSALIGRLVQTAYIWQQRSVERRQLLEMDSQMLSDIGIDRTEARKEATKPFWKA